MKTFEDILKEIADEANAMKGRTFNEYRELDAKYTELLKGHYIMYHGTTSTGSKEVIVTKVNVVNIVSDANFVAIKGEEYGMTVEANGTISLLNYEKYGMRTFRFTLINDDFSFISEEKYNKVVEKIKIYIKKNI